jgi:phospho-N-acetylmuramoyl-pentapeptide-transferase
MTDVNLLPYLAVFIIVLFITVFMEKHLIPILRKKAAQPIYTEGPEWHLKKQGTPTMGGVGFLIAVIIALLTATLFLVFTEDTHFALSLMISLLFGASNALIGVIDDRAKIKRNKNAGLTPLQKILLQTICATLFLLSRHILLSEGTYIYFSFGSVNLGMFYYPLCLLMLLGTVNCANLTDGIDGIASGVAFSIGVSLAYLSTNSNSEVGFISFAMMGAAVAFLIFNINPAKIFMGDTGSLFFGAMFAACCISLGNPLIILFSGIVYFIEGASVILQVLYYKLTKKRLFKMAPFHHHLEKCGWVENKIVIWAIIITIASSIPAAMIFI